MDLGFQRYYYYYYCILSTCCVTYRLNIAG